MKKALKYALIVALILQSGLDLSAQEETKRDRILRKFSLTPQVGLLHSWSDFKDDGLGGMLNQNELGLNLLLSYRLNKFISISTGGLYGKLSGSQDNVNTTGAVNEPSDLGYGILFKTDLFEFTLPRVDVNLSRLIFKDKSSFFNKVSVNLIGSHGLVYSNSKIYAQQDEGVNLLYGKRRGRTGQTAEAVTSYGMGLSYIINDRFDLGIESTIRNVWNDKLDAWVTPGSANDKYSYTAIGVTYHLKKRNDVVKKFGVNQPKLLAGADEVEKKEEAVEEVAEETVEEVEEVVEEKVVEEKKEEIVPVIEEKKKEVTPPVVEEKKEEVVEVKKDPTPVKEGKTVSAGDGSDLKIYEGGGNFIAVAAFRGLQGSKRMMDEVREKGETPVLIRNKKDTWYIITIGQYDDKEVALEKMRDARAKGYERAWVHIK